MVCDRRGNGDYSGGFYYFVRMVAANLPRSSGSLIKRSRGRLALGQELTRLLTGASKGGRRSTHVRRKPDRTYEVICTQPAPPSLLRLFARE